MIERIKELMEAKGLTSTQFADGIEVPRAIVSHILSGRNKPSLDVVLKVLEAYRDVRMEWLLLGEGEMLKMLAPAAAALPTEIRAPEPAAVPDKPPVPAGHSIGKVQQAVQPSESPAPVKEAAKVPARAIERIIIFYDDKTFDTYSPI